MQLWCCVVSLFPSLLGLVLGNRDSFIVQVQEVDDTVMSVLNPTYNLDHGSPRTAICSSLSLGSIRKSVVGIKIPRFLVVGTGCLQSLESRVPDVSFVFGAGGLAQS